MSELINYAVSGIWQFFWFLTITGLVITWIAQLTYQAYNRTLRHIIMMKHGYPPQTCDADGDFKEDRNTEEEQN